MSSDFNKNDKQTNFNKIIGVVAEKNDAPVYCSLTLNVGTTKVRPVNLCIKKDEYDKIIAPLEIGQKVVVYFYLRSKKSKDGKTWYNYNNILGVSVI